MSNSRRHGEIVAYWGTATPGTTGEAVPVAEAVIANTFSRPYYVGQNVDQYAFLVSVDAATTVSLYAAHSSELTIEGIDPDRDVPPPITQFYPVYAGGAAGFFQVKFTFSSAASGYFMVPEFVAGWTVLQSSAAANIIAGCEMVAL